MNSRKNAVIPYLLATLLLLIGASMASGQEAPQADTGCPPMTSCVPSPAPSEAANSTLAPPKHPAESPLATAADTVDNVTTGTLLVPKAVAQAVGDETAKQALNSPWMKGVGYATKGLSAAANVADGYRKGGADGAVAAGVQVTAETAADEAIVHGSAAIGGAFFGPPGAEVGELVGQGSTFVGGLIRKLPCGDTNVQGCVTDLEFEAYDHFIHSPTCDENGVCYDPNTGRTNMQPDPTPDSNSDARTRMEGEFNQTQAENAAASQAASSGAEVDSSGSGQDVLDLLALSSSLQQGLQSSQPATPARAPKPPLVSYSPAPSNGPPAGWVACTCPSQHASMGRFFGSQLYHPEGPKCR